MSDMKQHVLNFQEKKNIEQISLVILTPCYGGMVHVNYTVCLLKTKELCSELGIKLHIEFTKNESLIQRARNHLIAKAMFRQDTTHIMFIDSDITWNPIDIIKLILHDKEIVGGIYPFKFYDLNVLHNQEKLQKIKEKYNKAAYHKTLSFPEFLKQNLLKFNLNFIRGEQKIQENLLSIRHLATGFMMMKRSCIEKMIEHYPHTKYDCDTQQLQGNENKYCYALFDCFLKDGHYFSEDWGFCDRWKSIGGDIFTDVSITLGHSGVTDYTGRVLSVLDIN